MAERKVPLLRDDYTPGSAPHGDVLTYDEAAQRWTPMPALPRSPNMIDLSKIHPNTSINTDGTLRPNGERWTTALIPVEPNTTYVVAANGTPPAHNNVVMQRYAADGSTIGLMGNVPADTGRFDTTTLTTHIRLAPRNELMNTLQMEKGTTPTPHMPFGEVAIPGERVTGMSQLGTDVAALAARVEALEQATPPPTRTPDSLLVWETMPHTTRLLATSYDGNLYALVRTDGDGTKFRRSTDGGATFTAGFPVSALADSFVVAAFVFADGSVSLITQSGLFYHAASFTATPVLAHQTTTGNITNRLPTNSYQGLGGEQYVFAGEYDATSTQKLMYYSRDGGRPGTWSTLKAGDTFNAGNNHWHAVAYDPHADAVWLSQGDGDNSRIYWTPDWGGTWHQIVGTHPTEVYAGLPDRVVFGRDKTGEPPGIDHWVRGSEEVPATLTNGVTFRPDRSSFDFYPTRTDWNGPTDEYYIQFPARHADDTDAYIYGTGDGARSWHLVYHGPTAHTALAGIYGGHLFARHSVGNDTPLLRAKAPAWITQ